MTEAAFEYTPKQRRAGFAISAVFGVWGLAVSLYVVVRTAGHHHLADSAAVWIVFGFCPLLLSLLILRLTSGFTRIDAHGLHTRTVWRRRRCSWAEIADIDTVTEAGRGNAITRVRIVLADGRPFRLPVPYDSHWLTGDSDFGRKLEQIRQAWREAGHSGRRGHRL